MDRVKNLRFIARLSREEDEKERERETVADKASRPGRKTGRGETRRLVKGRECEKETRDVRARARVLGHSRLATGPVGPL